MPTTEYVGSVSSGAPPPAGSGVVRALWHAIVTTATVLVGLLGGLGWLWELRDAKLFNTGPAVSDALPLLQLATFDRQPLLRVVVAWFAIGLVVGLLLRRHDRLPRAALAGALAAVLLWFDSQASNALTRNVRFSDVLEHRSVGLGPWLEAAIFAVSTAFAPPRALAPARAGRRTPAT
jgi:hypothetical protein